MAEKLRPHFEDVQAHYDLSDEFYRLFLDPSQTYSCAYFERDDMTLEEAQQAKVDLALGKLGLKPGMTLLDIGCGWGSTMRRAVDKYDVNVIGLTLSKNQAGHVQKTLDAMDSPRTKEVRLAGWEEFDEPVDRIVSIGAFEHFGHDRYDNFFTMANQALPDDGVMLLHTITALTGPQMIDRGMPLTFEVARFVKFIITEIFPGGRLPSIEKVEDHSSKAGFKLTRTGGTQERSHQGAVRRGLRALHALSDRMRQGIPDWLHRRQSIHVREVIPNSIVSRRPDVRRPASITLYSESPWVGGSSGIGSPQVRGETCRRNHQGP
jgi:cyclopropane-fatty-acyl-phospholipid synthase